jgi:hypothetical protein
MGTPTCRRNSLIESIQDAKRRPSVSRFAWRRLPSKLFNELVQCRGWQLVTWLMKGRDQQALLANWELARKFLPLNRIPGADND